MDENQRPEDHDERDEKEQDETAPKQAEREQDRQLEEGTESPA